MSRADFYFIQNLHLMFDKSTLKKMSTMEGTTLGNAYQQKVVIEKHRLNPPKNDFEKEEHKREEENERMKSMINMLENLFKQFAGGGMSIERLKDIIRNKIKNIKPRDRII